MPPTPASLSDSTAAVPTPSPRCIWVLCGGPSTEFHVSLSSGRFVTRHMSAAETHVRPVVVDRRGQWIISERAVTADTQDHEWIDNFFEAAALDDTPLPRVELAVGLARMKVENVLCAFLAFHGQYGEDGAVQGLLQTAGIAYTGSGILASALAYNKAASLGIFSSLGLPVAKSVVCTRAQPNPPGLDQLRYPLFTKPVCGGSSLGVSLVKTPDALAAGIAHALDHDSAALAEEKIEGVEVSCGVLDFIEDGKVVSRPLPPTLISPCEAEFFDYEAKYVAGKSRDVTPAPLPAPVLERIQSIALKAHRALGCEGMSRTDLITMTDADAQPVILETQTLPGMTPTSLIPQQCGAAGISFAKFIDLLVEHALWRQQCVVEAP